MNTKFFFIVMFPLLLVSCGRDVAVLATDDSLGLTEIGVRPMGGALTRSAISGTAFPQGYDMMVSTYHNGTTSADYFENVAFGYDATSDAWKSKSGVKYFPLEGTLDFLGARARTPRRRWCLRCRTIAASSTTFCMVL